MTEIRVHIYSRRFGVLSVVLKKKRTGFSVELEGEGRWEVQEFHAGLLTGYPRDLGGDF